MGLNCNVFTPGQLDHIDVCNLALVWHNIANILFVDKGGKIIELLKEFLLQNFIVRVFSVRCDTSPI